MAMQATDIHEGQPSRYVDGQYEQANPTWHDEDAPWKAQKIAEFLRDESVTPESVCDLGCGAGGVLAGLARRMPGTKLVGYDISPQAIELARRLHPEVQVRLGEPKEGSDRFDLVLLVDVFEHVEDYLGLLRRVAPLGKRLVCHIPLDMTALMVARAKPILKAREQIGHLHYFSKDTAIATLRDASYDVQAFRYTAGAIDLPGRTMRTKIAQWPRRVGFRVAPDFTVRTLGGYSLMVLCTPQTGSQSPRGT
ncbi:MAG: class I SAM-dependent methyltransferase [Mycobacterium sp.]